MKIRVNTGESSPKKISGAARKLVILLAALVVIEALILLIATVWMITRFFFEPANNVAGAALLAGITAIITVWLGWTAVSAYREQPWVRGSIVTWQILQVSVSVGIFQGFFSQPGLSGELNEPTVILAWGLLTLAIAAFILVFVPAVNQRLRRSDERR